jgi:hypothetical protein
MEGAPGKSDALFFVSLATRHDQGGAARRRAGMNCYRGWPAASMACIPKMQYARFPNDHMHMRKMRFRTCKSRHSMIAINGW